MQTTVIASREDRQLAPAGLGRGRPRSPASPAGPATASPGTRMVRAKATHRERDEERPAQRPAAERLAGADEAEHDQARPRGQQPPAPAPGERSPARARPSARVESGRGGPERERGQDAPGGSSPPRSPAERWTCAAGSSCPRPRGAIREDASHPSSEDEAVTGCQGLPHAARRDAARMTLPRLRLVLLVLLPLLLPRRRGHASPPLRPRRAPPHRRGLGVPPVAAAPPTPRSSATAAGTTAGTTSRIAALEVEHRHDVAFLERLATAGEGQAVRRGPAERRAQPRDQHERDRGRRAGRQYLLPLSHLRVAAGGHRQFPGVQNAGPLAKQLRFQTLEDYRDWLARLDAFPTYVDQIIALMRRGHRAGRWSGPGSCWSASRPSSTRAHRRRADGDLFYRPFTRMPDDAARGASGSSWPRPRSGSSATASSPLTGGCATSSSDSYLPAAPTEVGVWQWPDGERLYAYWVRRLHHHRHHRRSRSTRSASPRWRASAARWRRCEARSGLQGHAAEYFQHLRTDPRYFYKTPRRAAPALPRPRQAHRPAGWSKLFGTLPRAPYGVEPTPAAMAPDATTGFYYPAADDGSRAGDLLGEPLPARDAPHAGRWCRSPCTRRSPATTSRRALAAEQQDLPAVPPPPLRRGLRRGLGALLRDAGRRAGRPRRPRRQVRAADLRDVARRAPGGRHRDARQGLEPRAGHPVLPGERAAARAGRHQRGGPLHRPSRGRRWPTRSAS